MAEKSTNSAKLAPLTVYTSLGCIRGRHQVWTETKAYFPCNAHIPGRKYFRTCCRKYNSLDMLPCMQVPGGSNTSRSIADNVSAFSKTYAHIKQRSGSGVEFRVHFKEGCIARCYCADIIAPLYQIEINIDIDKYKYTDI